MGSAAISTIHPLRLRSRVLPVRRDDSTPLDRLPPPLNTAPDDLPARFSEDSGLWTDDAAPLAPALALDGGSALAAARQLWAFLLDGAANMAAPLTVHLPGSHDAAFAWQLWCNLHAEAAQWETLPVIFRLYHTLPTVAEHDDLAELIAQGRWQLATGEVTAQAGQHAALIAHGHYSQRPAKLAWNDYGEAWQLQVVIGDDGPCWRVTPRADYRQTPLHVQVGAAAVAPDLPPLFEDAHDQQWVAHQQYRADRGLAILPVTLFADLDALCAQHPDGVLVYIADLAHGHTAPQTLPHVLDPALPLNIAAVQARHAELATLWRADGAAAAVYGVLQQGQALWPCTAFAAQTGRADTLFGDAPISLDALVQAGYNPRYLVRHHAALEAQAVEPRQRKAWLAALEQVWLRHRSPHAEAFVLGCVAVHFAHYGLARVAFMEALPLTDQPAPVLHNLGLLEIVTGSAQRAADILDSLEAIEPHHPKTRRLRQHFIHWQACCTPRLGWHPDQACDVETGLRLSPLMSHHARELAWACRHSHDMVLTRLPDLAEVEAAGAWIARENAHPLSLCLGILHPAWGLVGWIGLRQEAAATNVCVYTAPEWRGQGWMRAGLRMIAASNQHTEVWSGNRRSQRVLAGAD